MELWTRNRVESYKDAAVEATKREAESKLKETLHSEEINNQHTNKEMVTGVMNVVLEKAADKALEVIEHNEKVFEQKLTTALIDAEALRSKWEVSQLAFKKMAHAYGQTLGKTENNIKDDNIYSNVEVIKENPELIAAQLKSKVVIPSTQVVQERLAERGNDYNPNLHGVGDDFGKPKILKTPKI